MIKLKNTPDQVELAKAIGSKNQAISRPAQEAYAAAIGPVIQKVLNQLGTASLLYTDYELEGAVSLPKKYARSQSALNILSRATERLVNEILIKQELQGWAVALKAVGEASDTINGTATKHTIAAGTAGTFKLDDLSRLL